MKTILLGIMKTILGGFAVFVIIILQIYCAFVLYKSLQMDYKLSDIEIFTCFSVLIGGFYSTVSLNKKWNNP